jgi:hypothetical protein
MDPVTGSIVYDAASTTSNINSLTSINLTIAGHTYLLSEVGFISPAGSNQLIGGLSFGVGGIFHGTDDFSIRWNETTLIPFDFTYATTLPSGGIFRSATFTQFSVTAAAAVPEPSSLALLAAGVASLCVFLPFARRRLIDNPFAWLLRAALVRFGGRGNDIVAHLLPKHLRLPAKSVLVKLRHALAIVVGHFEVCDRVHFAHVVPLSDGFGCY